MRNNGIFYILPILFFGLASYRTALAQRSDVRFSPPILYTGKNVITVQSPNGIERITGVNTRDIHAELPAGLIPGCPKTVDITVWVGRPTTLDYFAFTVHECDGGFTSRTIRVENWSLVRTEYSGPVEIGSDTCLPCFVESSRPQLIDSITVSNPDLSVRILEEPGPGGLYVVHGGVPFRYRVCYSARRRERLVDTVRLYFQRDFPSGGLSEYIIRKPFVLNGVEPPPPAPIVKDTLPPVPPLNDPTTFRNIVMPSARSPRKGEFFYGNYVIAGNMGGYGVTPRLSLLAGAVIVPDFIGRLYLGSLGVKYEFFSSDLFRGAGGAQVAFSSTENSDIRTIAPYLVGSLGNDRHMLSAALGLGIKRHVTPAETFNRNAWTFALGGNTTISRGWKLAAEVYLIETSGIVPVAISARKFTDSFAFDFGLGLDLVGGSDILFTNGLQGEIKQLAFAPFISGMWVF